MHHYVELLIEANEEVGSCFVTRFDKSRQQYPEVQVVQVLVVGLLRAQAKYRGGRFFYKD